MAILSETSRVRNGSTEVSMYKLLNDEADVNTSSTAVDVLDASSLTLLVESSAGTASGVVTLEGARTSDYSGTWASITTATTNAASTTFVSTVNTGDTSSVPVPYVRARISTVIGSGTVDVYLIVRRE
jgi:hypothetical protein